MWRTKLFKFLEENEDETLDQYQGRSLPEAIPSRLQIHVAPDSDVSGSTGFAVVDKSDQGILPTVELPRGSSLAFADDGQVRRSKSSPTQFLISTTSIWTDKVKPDPHEWHWLLLQVTIPLLLAGGSLIFAGFYLSILKDTRPAFKRWRELVVLVIPLLDVKSQLELTSVSRFNTHLTLGQIPKRDRLDYCVADVAVSMVQAVIAAVASAYFAMLLVWIHDGMPPRTGNSDVWIILAVSCVTASITCILTCSWPLLAVLTTTATFVCFKYHVDPNRVVVSVVACIGDVSVVGFLDLTSGGFLQYEERQWIPALVTVIIFIISIVMGVIAHQHPFTRSSLLACWFPILLVVVLSGFAGLLLVFEGQEFQNVELYQPLTVGMSGTIVAIHYGIISRRYFKYCAPGKLPVSPDGTPGKVCLAPWIFWPTKIQTTTYLFLLGISIPAQALFSLLIWAFVPSHTKPCFLIFFTLYVTLWAIQATILLYLSHVLLRLLWKWKIDPGFYVISCLHGFGDILATLFLLMCCETYKLKSCSST